MPAVDMDYTPLQHHATHHEFDVIAAFSGLDTGRKMALFDLIMCGRINAYRNNMKVIWPDSNDDDARKLELVLRSRINRLSQSA